MKKMIALLSVSLLGSLLFMGAKEADADRYYKNSYRSQRAAKRHARKMRRHRRAVRRHKRALRRHRRAARRHKRAVRRTIRRSIRHFFRSLLGFNRRYRIHRYYVVSSHLGRRARRILRYRYNNNVQRFCRNFSGYCSIRHRRVYY